MYYLKTAGTVRGLLTKRLTSLKFCELESDKLIYTQNATYTQVVAASGNTPPNRLKCLDLKKKHEMRQI